MILQLHKFIQTKSYATTFAEKYVTIYPKTAIKYSHQKINNLVNSGLVKNLPKNCPKLTKKGIFQFFGNYEEIRANIPMHLQSYQLGMIS